MTHLSTLPYHNLISVVIIVIAALVIGGTVNSIILKRIHNPTLKVWLRDSIWVIILWVGAVTVFSLLGFSSAVNLGVIGILTITLLVQGLAQSIEYGAIILFEHRFKIGDVISCSGYTGVVEDIGLRITTITDFNKNVIYIPNTILFSSPIQRMDKTILTNIHIGDKVTYFGTAGIVTTVTPFYVALDMGEGQSYYIPTSSLATGAFIVQEKINGKT